MMKSSVYISLRFYIYKFEACAESSLAYLYCHLETCLIKLLYTTEHYTGYIELFIMVHEVITVLHSNKGDFFCFKQRPITLLLVVDKEDGKPDIFILKISFCMKYLDPLYHLPTFNLTIWCKKKKTLTAIYNLMLSGPYYTNSETISAYLFTRSPI